MTYSVDQLSKHLFEELALKPKANFYIAYSGGKDSATLLHMMAQLQQEHGFSLTALHVNHNLNSDSNEWAKHCSSICAELGVALKQTSLHLPDNSELNARVARYQWFREQIQADSYLLTAHHADDRAETLLFNLMRGSGSRGLSSLRSVTPFYGSKLVRPLLDVSQQQVSEYAQHHQLNWVEDPSNQQLHYARNRIRHEVLPAMTQFRPDAIKNIVRAANNLEQENNLLREVAIGDLVEVREHPKHPLDDSVAICYHDFAHLSIARQSNLVRFWLQSLDLHTPSQRLLGELLTAFGSIPKSTMLLQENGCQFRFYQGFMYVMPVLDETPAMPCIDWHNVDQPLDLYENKIQVDATSKLHSLLKNRQPSPSVVLSSRANVINPKALQGHSLNLKKWLQESGVPPWRRQAIPLLTIRHQNADLVLSPIDQQLHSDWVSLKTRAYH